MKLIHYSKCAQRFGVTVKGILLLAAIEFLPPEPCYAQTFSDGNFTNWTYVELAAAGSWAQIDQLATGGNPENCIQCTTQSGENAWSICVNNSAVWRPSQDGAICSVGMTIDVKSISGWGDGQGIAIVVVQGGQRFMSTTDITLSATSWTNRSYGFFSSTQFCRIVHANSHDPTWLDCSAHPDFSTNGGPITFGFMAGNSRSNQYSQLYDNWLLSVIVVPRLNGTWIHGGGTNAFSLTGFAAKGQTVVVQASTNLTDWVSIKTNILDNPTFEFVDTDAGLYPHRFYRTQSP